MPFTKFVMKVFTVKIYALSIFGSYVVLLRRSVHADSFIMLYGLLVNFDQVEMSFDG